MDSSILKGAWKKVRHDGCRETYPDVIVFQEKGIFNSELNTPGDKHPIWDVGTYKIEGSSLQLSTANDRIVSYPFRMENDHLLIVAEDGCELLFQRIS